jgi:hypothetical protein
MDAAFIALTLGLFALSWGFVRFCAALEPAQEKK